MPCVDLAAADSASDADAPPPPTHLVLAELGMEPVTVVLGPEARGALERLVARRGGDRCSVFAQAVERLAYTVAE